MPSGELNTKPYQVPGIVYYGIYEIACAQGLLKIGVTIRFGFKSLAQMRYFLIEDPYTYYL